jgi:hypothetical protein
MGAIMVRRRSGHDLVSATGHDAGVRLRLGVLLWLLSWMPVAVILDATGAERLLIWTVQVIVGLAGLAIAGSVFATTVRAVGWRHAPGVAWRSLVHGESG